MQSFIADTTSSQGIRRHTVLDDRYLQILILLTCIGAFLRVYHLTFNSLWGDEVATYYFSSQPTFSDIWLSTMNGEFNPPLFYWIEHLMLYFGNSPFILRSIPAVLGIVTIPLFYLVGTEFLDRHGGIIMAALLTFSPFHIIFSQEARAYSAMLFFITLTLIFYFKALRSNTWKHWVLFGLFSSFAGYTHFYAFIPVILLFIIAISLNFRKILDDIRYGIPFLSGVLLFLLVSLPLIVVAGRLFVLRVSIGPVYGIQGLRLLLETMKWLSGFNVIIVLILYLTLFIIGLVMIFHIQRYKSYFLITMILIPLLLSWALSYRIPMNPRYLIFLLPIFYLGIAAAYRAFCRFTKAERVTSLFILAIVIINIPALSFYYQNPVKSDWKGLSDTMREVVLPGDVIVIVQESKDPWNPFDYYFDSTSQRTLRYDARSVAELDEISRYKGQNRTFYVLATGNTVDPQGTILDWLTRHAEKKEMNNYGFYLYVSE